MSTVVSPDSADLLRWYDRQRRSLPWREDPTPYRVWLSEIMLQQTRVETVLPYYRRFLDRFPTVHDLAAAPIEDVLALWSGLGYYRRARQLHDAARRIVARGGQVPQDLAGLLALPGIGPYTAAAIASIVFGVREPVLDGNVERLTARLLTYSGNPKSKEGRETLRARALELLDRARPGDSNQAMMELGATVCTPRRPRCRLCPLRTSCRAAAEGNPERYPPPRARRATERIRGAMAVVRGGEGGGRVLLFRRPDTSGVLAGMWELPWVEIERQAGTARADGKSAASDDLASRLADRYGGRWSLLRPLGRVRHTITFRALEMEVWSAGLASDADLVAEENEAGWFSAADRRLLPQSSWIAKALRLARTSPNA